MELTLTMRLRIAASVGVGVAVIGVLGWPFVAPDDPLGALSILDGSLSLGGAVVLVFLAFVAGIAGYFVSWPYGRQIGILAVPSGLALWALRCGSVADLLRHHAGFEDRMAIFSALKWEPLFWLALVLVGFAGAWACETIYQPKTKPIEGKKKSADRSGKPDIFVSLFGVFLGPVVRGKFTEWSQRRQQARSQSSKSEPNVFLNAVLAVAGSVVIALLGIRMFARDVAVADPQLGQVVGQPAVAQIAFAAFLSFGIASFAVKRLLDAEYFWPVLATGLVTMSSAMLYVKQDVLEHMARNWPVLFFSKAVLSILPIQIVAFGTLGAVWGYWMAIRYAYWRKHG